MRQPIGHVALCALCDFVFPLTVGLRESVTSYTDCGNFVAGIGGLPAYSRIVTGEVVLLPLPPTIDF